MLWVGAPERLYRHDGDQATEYRPDSTDPGSLSDVEVRGLYQADEGALWVATLGGGVNRRDPRSLSDLSAFSIAEDREGNVPGLVRCAIRNGLVTPEVG